MKRDLQLLGFKILSESFLKAKFCINPIYFHVNFEHSSWSDELSKKNTMIYIKLNIRKVYLVNVLKTNLVRSY